MRSARPTAPLLVVTSLAIAMASGCSSSFFQISKENAETPSAPPADRAPAAPPQARVPPPIAAPPTVTPPPTVVPPTVVTPPRPIDSTRIEPSEPEPIAQASDSAGIERLVQLARVWSAVAHYHPWVHSRGIAWDSALVRAVPRVRSATNAGEMRTALTSMLSALDDPATHFVETTTVGESRPIASMTTRDSVFVLHLPTDRVATENDAAATLQTLAAGLTNYPRVVLDLRAMSVPDAQTVARTQRIIDESGLAAALTTDRLTLPVERRRIVGAMYVDQLPGQFAIGGVPAAWRHSTGGLIQGRAPQLTTPAPRPRGRNRTPLPPLPLERRIVIVANEHTVWPASIAALASNGYAAVFADGRVTDAWSVQTTSMTVRGVGVLQLRQGELVHGNGEVIRADTNFAASTAADTTTASIAAALRAVRTGVTRSAGGAMAGVNALPAAFDTAAYPVMGARVLSVMRLWTAMRTLHAHRDAYDDDLDDQFRKALPMAEAARTPAEYASALRMLASSADDSRVMLRGTSFEQSRGEFAIPLRLHWVENRPVVVQVANDDAARASGMSVGDEIVSVEGFPITAWVGEMRRAVPASNDWARHDALLDVMRRGPRGSALLRVRDSRGRERNIELPRSLRFDDSTAFTVTPRVFLTMVGDARIVDATATGNTEGLQLASARAVIVDLRGSVTDSGEAVIRRLMPHLTHPIARTVRRGSSQWCDAVSLRESQSACADERRSEPVRMFDSGDEAGFAGIVVVLVDERTDRRGEWLALALEHAGARLAGSPTAGAMARVSWLDLPGRLQLAMPLEEVRRVDGGQLHRVGLTPQLEYRQTLQAVRAGSDNVMDRTIQWVRQQLAPPPERRRR